MSPSRRIIHLLRFVFAWFPFALGFCPAAGAQGLPTTTALPEATIGSTVHCGGEAQPMRAGSATQINRYLTSRPPIVHSAPQSTSMLVSGPAIDSNGIKSFSVTSIFQGQKPTIVRVLEPIEPTPNLPHRFLYVLPVEPGVTSLLSSYSDGLEELRRLDVHNRYNLTLIAPSFHIVPWYGDHESNPHRKLESFIIKDLVPFGDSFAVPGERPERWVLGFSKSGNGALILIFRNPEIFGAAGAWDAPVQITSGSGYAGHRENFGSDENFAQYTIPTLVEKIAPLFRTRNRLWISAEPSAWTAHMMVLHRQLEAAGIVHTFRLRSCERVHSWASGWLEDAVSMLNANSTLTVSANRAAH